MSSTVREFIGELDNVRVAITGAGVAQLSSQVLRGRVQRLVDTYFTSVRPGIVGNETQLEALREAETGLQELLSLSHGRSLVSKYKRVLKTVRETLVAFDGVVTAQPASQTNKVSDVDKTIIATLTNLVPSAALSYCQAITDLQAEHRFSWRGPATDLREALRETLDHLAPDVEVAKGDGFKLEADAKGPTMKQKVRHILRKRGVSKTLTSAPESAAESVEAAIGGFVRSVYTRSNVSTHTPTDKSEVLRVRDWVRVSLCELLEIPT